MRTRPLILAATLALMWGVAPATSALAQAQASGDSQTVIIQQAPTDHTVAIPKEQIEKYFKDMDAKNLQTLRMLEGGKYNVNVRRITNAETALVHPKTIDLWVILEGSGTLTTGGTIQNGKIVGGQSHTIKAGDVEFIPPTVAHGVSGVQGSLTWLNIRWDTDWK
jgi:mannose-6-phosphate isomerase-like protein (cupin superfamily)